MLSPENKEKLRKFERQILLWHNDKSISLNSGDREAIQDIIRTVEPGYSVMWWCTHCVACMLDKAYKLLNE